MDIQVQEAIFQVLYVVLFIFISISLYLIFKIFYILIAMYLIMFQINRLIQLSIMGRNC